MAKISIINPNDAKCYIFSRARTKRIPLGQSYVAAVLLRAGHEVFVIDASADDLSEEEIVNKVVDNKSEFVGIGGTTPLYSQISSLTRKIKTALPTSVIILGGPHVSALPIPSLNHLLLQDVRGEVIEITLEVTTKEVATLLQFITFFNISTYNR